MGKQWKVISWDMIYFWWKWSEVGWNNNIGLEYLKILVDKVAGFERNICNFERSSTVSKILSTSVVCYTEIVPKQERQLMQQTSLLS